MENILEIKKLSKKFQATQALKDISFNIKRGSIHGIIGTNGSGKSTLLNILFGNETIKDSGGYSGTIIFDGKNVDPFKGGIKKEMGMVHQEFIFLPGMSIWENITLGDEVVHRGFERVLGRELSPLILKENKKVTWELLKSLGIDIPVDVNIDDLSTNIKQFIEIAREIRKKDLKILFLDEPTASLNSRDSQILMGILKKMAQGGLTIVFISHRLDEISDICQRLTVIRDGVLVNEYDKSEFNIKKMERDMTGYELDKLTIAKRRIKKDPVLEFSDFGVDMDGDESKDINLSVNKGEIVGISSLSGHGKLSLGYGLGGLRPTRGIVKFCGKPLDTSRVSENIKRGVVILTEDRKNLNLLMEQSVEDNIAFTNTAVKKRFLKDGLPGLLGFPDCKKIVEYTRDAVSRLDIKVSSSKQKLKELSGGNQQKVSIARAVSLSPELLFIGEPTRGIDVAAKERVLKGLIDLNRVEGTTIIIASSEVEELERICDRIVVLHKGSVSHILTSNRIHTMKNQVIRYA